MAVNSLGFFETISHRQDDKNKEASSNQRSYKANLKDTFGKRRTKISPYFLDKNQRLIFFPVASETYSLLLFFQFIQIHSIEKKKKLSVCGSPSSSLLPE